MDLERQPIQIFIREALMKTPQGLVVIASFVIYWILSVGVMVFPEYLLADVGLRTGALILFIPWPFVSLMINLKLSSPNYTSSMSSLLIIGFFSLLPLWWVYT